MRRSVVLASAVWTVLAIAPPARAGHYHTDVLAAFDLDVNGYALPLGHTSFMSSVNLAGEADQRPGKFGESEKHKELVRSVRERMKRGNLTPEETLSLCNDLLRLRRDDWAIRKARNLLQPLTRNLPDGREFLTLAHLSHANYLPISLTEGRNLPRAAHMLEWALDQPFPASMPELTPKQLTWYRRLEKDYYLPFINHRANDKRRPDGHDVLDPIFPGPAAKGLAPVRYVGESREYEPGALAAAEKAKLPPDAIAIVQQMILWDPDDSRLWWQLAELYNAFGDLESASQVFAMLLDFTSPLRLNVREVKDHARAVDEALTIQRTIAEQMRAAKERQEEAARREAEHKQRMRELAVGSGVGLVLLFVTYWQTREFIRRRRVRRAGAMSPTKHVE